ncbi:uncharacterized protein K444DRAFT_180759 [Hyaloscypha bicolor E]|uniref:Uncharacterized protein n=1 Tax=Hyaloscypha bicolor E TaxID=1095630 RepID=A0A2J6TR28_9HELO|nr:uncharacterized protein K444DRAFT_180759 [Hyaloscypha bicolor E]PMD65452.1 hypothetical protein K444DRAFT_180759 [Hyaloscypha bicolor E]
MEILDITCRRRRTKLHVSNRPPSHQSLERDASLVSSTCSPQPRGLFSSDQTLHELQTPNCLESSPTSPEGSR